MKRSLLLLLLIVAVPAFARERLMSDDFKAADAGRFARLALACVHKEYPNKISHTMNSDSDVDPASEAYACLLRLL